MINRLLLLVLLINVSYSFSQLTRSEVYDFSIGDYFGIEHKSKNVMSAVIPVRYQMFHILSKQMSITTDTVTYVAERQTYIPQLPDGNGGSFPSSYSIDTISFSHDELNQPYTPEINGHVFGNDVNCFWVSDTNECYSVVNAQNPSSLCISNSGVMVYYGMHINDIDSCELEPITSEYFAYSHAGGPFGGKDCVGDPTFQTYLIELNYVLHDGVACGTFPGFFVNINELQQELQLLAYPNPTKNSTTITGISVIAKIYLTSSNGMDVTGEISNNNNQLDISKLSSGVYTLKVIDEFGNIGFIRIVKE